MIYLDYNATAPVRPQVIEAITGALADHGNPSSVHGMGRRARGVVESAREILAAMVGTVPETVTFTSGGTEANTLALRGAAGHCDVLMVSEVEHDSVLAAAGAMDLPLTRFGVDRNGVIDLAALDDQLSACAGEGRRPLVSVMLANNETGVIEPVAEIARLVHDVAGGLVHTDAVQGLGKIPMSFCALGVDLMSLSAHKIGGPPGVGALVVRDGLPLVPVLAGGGQERGRRSGTENVAGIAGFAAALEALEGEAGLAEQLGAWRAAFEDRLRAWAPDCVIFGADADRLANTTCFAVPGLTGETQVMALDLGGVAVSSGAACSSGKVTRSHVLSAMGADDVLASSAIRVSTGWNTSKDDLDRAAAVWSRHYDRWAGRNRPQAAAG